MRMRSRWLAWPTRSLWVWIVIGAATTEYLVRQKLVASLARPGGNVTGVTNLSPDLSTKRLELVKEIVPRAMLVAVLWDAEGPVPARAFKEIEMAGQALGVIGLLCLLTGAAAIVAILVRSDGLAWAMAFISFWSSEAASGWGHRHTSGTTLPK